MAAYYPLFDDDTNIGPPGIPGIGFKLTNDGNYDMEGHILQNAGEPSENTDVATKSYVDKNKIFLKSSIHDLSDKSLTYEKGDYYDAKGKTIRNLSNPVEQSDSATKNYIDATINQLRSISLVHAARGNFDAKGKTINNVKDPESEKNVLNKRYFENNAIILKDNKYDAKNKIICNVEEPVENGDVVSKKYLDYYCIKWDKDMRIYHAHNERISHVKTPLWPNDVTNKAYVDSKTQINDKKEDNLLSRDADGLYVPSLIKNGIYNFGKKRISNVSDPLIPIDVATKNYVDSRDFYAMERDFFDCSPNRFKVVNFSMFSSKLLDERLSLKENMYMKITIYTMPSIPAIRGTTQPITIRLELNGIVRLLMDLDLNKQESVTTFERGKKNDVVKLSISCEDNVRLKPYLHIKRIDFL